MKAQPTSSSKSQWRSIRGRVPDQAIRKRMWYEKVDAGSEDVVVKVNKSDGHWMLLQRRTKTQKKTWPKKNFRISSLSRGHATMCKLSRSFHSVLPYPVSTSSDHVHPLLLIIIEIVNFKCLLNCFICVQELFLFVIFTRHSGPNYCMSPSCHYYCDHLTIPAIEKALYKRQKY